MHKCPFTFIRTHTHTHMMCTRINETTPSYLLFSVPTKMEIYIYESRSHPSTLLLVFHPHRIFYDYFLWYNEVGENGLKFSSFSWLMWYYLKWRCFFHDVIVCILSVCIYIRYVPTRVLISNAHVHVENVDALRQQSHIYINFTFTCTYTPTTEMYVYKTRYTYYRMHSEKFN